MIRKLKLKDALKLMQSNMYILITEKSTSILGDFDGYDKDMKLHALREARDALNRQIKLAEKTKGIKVTGKNNDKS